MPSSSSSGLLKGALIPLRDDGTPGQRITFQYNPERIRRRLVPREGSGGGASAQPPLETITCSLLLDATDALEHPDEHPDAVEHGIYPGLAALELLMYPRSAVGSTIWPFSWLSGGGTRTTPVALFVWGEGRVVPVRVVGLDILETAYDTSLRPIRARVGMRMRVLTEGELSSQPGGARAWREHEARLRAQARLL